MTLCTKERRQEGFYLNRVQIRSPSESGLESIDYPGEFGGAPTSGWSETIGESEAEAVFRMVDAAIASIAENHSRLPHLSTSELMASTWSNLSRSISTGMIASTKTSEVRIAGLEKSGELQILDSYVMENCGDVDGILMTF